MQKRGASVAWGALVGMTLLFAAPLAHAGPATDAVRAKQTTLRELAAKAPVDAKKVHAVVDQLLDYRAMAESALGAQWSSRSDAEKQEFSNLFAQLLRSDYEGMSNRTTGWKIEYLGDSAASGGASVVKTKATPTNPQEEPVRIDFSLVQKDGAWRVQDILTNGVSVVSGYRSQFVKSIEKDGFQAFVAHLKTKVAKGA